VYKFKPDRSTSARLHSNMTHPQIYTQKFMCGHPDEFIEVQSHGHNTVVHNLLPKEVFEKCAGKTSQVVYTPHCVRCAKQAEIKDHRNLSIGRKILQSAYMAGLSSTSTIGDDTVPEDGFDRISERYKCRDTSDPKANPHPPVTEAEHTAHRFNMQIEASHLRGKPSSVPARRVWNAPLQKPHQTEAGDRRHVHRSRVADADISRSSVNTQPPRETLESAVNNKISRETKLNRSIPNAVPLTDENNTNRSNALNVRALPGKNIDTERTISNTKNENESKAKTKVSLTTNGSAVLPRKSRFKEHFEDEIYSNPILDEPEPRAAQVQTAVLSQSLPDSFKSSTPSTKDTSLPELLTRNFRGLHLPGQNVLRPLKKESESNSPDSDSPDWVCETSSAIEAGRMTMDDVTTQFKGQRRR
jgi:hypothetical protein